MDNFINLAKQGYETYQKSQSHTDVSDTGVSRTGGHEYNSPSHSGQSGEYNNSPDFDQKEVVNRAESQGSGDRSLFNDAMDFVNNNKGEHQQPVNEEHVVDAHQQVYKNGNGGNVPASSLGSAAALQILKQFTSGGGGGSKTELISMAMAEASKLFDQNGAASGNKQDAVNGAGMTVMKLLVQSKFGGGVTGGSSSGGLGSIMGLASKFM